MRGGREALLVPNIGYDSLGQVISGHKFWSDGTPVAGQLFDYAFDNIGNRTQTLAGGDQNGLNQRNTSYTANALNEYTQRTVPGAVDVMGISYSTNTVTVNGNTAYRKGEYFRYQLVVGNASAALWTNVTVAATGQTSITGNVFVAQSPESYGYDADGNMTNDGRWVFTWDGENRLVSLQGLSGIPTGAKCKLDFIYDAQGRRLQKLVSTNNGSAYYPLSTNRFLYDGWNMVAIVNPQSSTLQSFVWGLDLSGTPQGAGGVGGLLEVNDAANGVNFVGFDGNGNVGGLVKATDGTISATYEYGPFGEVIRSTGTMAKANPFRFSAEYQDDETDRVMFPYRPYGAGRFETRDPLGEPGASLAYRFGTTGAGSSEEAGGPNLYSFVNNDPIGELDPQGLSSFSYTSEGRSQRDPWYWSLWVALESGVRGGSDAYAYQWVYNFWPTSGGICDTGIKYPGHIGTFAQRLGPKHVPTASVSQGAVHSGVRCRRASGLPNIHYQRTGIPAREKYATGRLAGPAPER
jgi:RHS repeat-associated protein